MTPITSVRTRTNQQAIRERRFRAVLVYTFLFLVAGLVLLPMIWTVATSLRLPQDSFVLPPKWLPTDFRWQNYRDVFDQVPYTQFILNSLKVSVLTVIGQIATSTLAGYAFARLRFPGKNVLFILLMSALMIPIFVTIIPLFIIIRNLKLVDSHAALILPSLMTPFGIFLMRQFYLSIPNDLEDAAKIDGASALQSFWHIFLPLGMPGVAVLAILSFNAQWNEYFRPLIFLNTWEKFTLPLGIVSLQGPASQGTTAVVLAGVAMSLIPTVVLVIFAQRYLVEGIILTGTKG